MNPETRLTPVQLRDHARLSLEDVANALKIPIETFRSWEALEEEPQLLLWQTLKLTKLYEVSVEELAKAFGQR